MIYARIKGTGGYVPNQILTNDDLAQLVETTDEWIMKRVGVSERRVVGDSSDNSSTMAVAAAQQALAAAQLDAQQIEMIVVATATPQYYFPSTACMVQRGLNIRQDIPALDINAACAGFVYALSVANQYISSGTVKSALVIGTESLTKLVDWTDRSTCILFGDGAGAVVLQADEQPGIVTTLIHANGHYSDLITAANPIWNPNTPAYLTMRGSEVFKIAVTKLGEIVDETVKKSSIEKSDIDWLIPHQANMRIITALTKRLALPIERVILTIEKHGNTSAASIPLALNQAVQQGKIKVGDTLLLEAFGAGLTWGSALLKY